MALDTTTIEAGESVQLSGMGTGTILWSPATGLSCTTCTNPIATPTETTTYTLEVTNAAGCSNSEKITITVTPPDCTPKIPNAFTPNSDSTNDSFFPIGNTIDAYNLTIYNRWGQEIFSDTKPWDGQLGGKDAPCDVYIYKLNMQICGNNQTFLGDVTLIR
jgi:gliding motility-associated-like protein